MHSLRKECILLLSCVDVFYLGFFSFVRFNWPDRASPFLRRILIRTILSDYFIAMGCSKNLKRRQRFYLHINRSGQPDLTFGKYTGTKMV